MARGRMLSKDISLDEKVDALSDDTARLLFTWMIPHLDVEGRMYGDAQIFKSIVAPRRNYSVKRVEKYLTEMGNLGLIERYTVDGNCYLFAPHFEKHQIGLRKDKEAQSKIPPVTTDLSRNKDGASPPQTKVKEKLKLKRKEDKDSSSINIFEIYETEIGKLTPFISEELKGAEKLFGAETIRDAIKIAVKANKRTWSYVSGVLENWARDGKGSRKQSPGTDPDRFVKGKYGHMVQR